MGHESAPQKSFQPELGLEWEIHEEPIDTRSEQEREEEDLVEGLGHIWDIAKKQHLDPYPTNFTITSPEAVNRIGAHGVPGRFLHWTFGREFDKMNTQYHYGLSRIYELVVNSNASEAFLLENNKTIDNKFVMAHVLGHTDFFKNNFRFESTREDMLEVVARNAARIESYEDQYGMLEVEQFLDATISLEDYVDPYQQNRPYGDEERNTWEARARKKVEVANKPAPRDEYDEFFARDNGEEEREPRVFNKADLQIPPKPDSDVLGFIRNHAKFLEDWQRDIVDIVREESIYFFPQRRTKIMNEGWAAYWHKRIMREMSDEGHITGEEDEYWIKLHSGVVSESERQLNPYHLGMMVYEYLEDRYNGHLNARETKWLESQGEKTYPPYDGPLEDSPAALKLREVMMANDDQSIIRNYFDKNLADRMHMYIYEEHEIYGRPVKIVKENGWQEIRDKLVQMLDNNGSPHIEVVDGDFRKSGQLYLRHGFDGRYLDLDYIERTMPFLYKLWQRPVHLETVREKNGEQVVVQYSYFGGDSGLSVETRDDAGYMIP